MDVITCGPLTPLATYGTYSGLYPSDQDALTPGTIILSGRVPGLHRVPVIAHEPSMSSLCEGERKQDRERDRCEVCLRYFTKSLRATVFMQTVYSTVVRGYS